MPNNIGAFGENFPYTNQHDMNMDWLIKIAKDFLDQYTHLQEILTNGEQNIINLTNSGMEQLQEKADDLEALLQEWYDTHSNDIANVLAQSIIDFRTEAYNYTQTVIASIPQDYSDLAITVQNIEKELTKVTTNFFADGYAFNMLDPQTAHDGGYYDQNGNIVQYLNYVYYDKFPIKPDVAYSFLALRGTTMYEFYSVYATTFDENGNVVEYINGSPIQNKTFTGASYIGISLFGTIATTKAIFMQTETNIYIGDNVVVPYKRNPTELIDLSHNTTERSSWIKNSKLFNNDTVLSINRIGNIGGAPENSIAGFKNAFNAGFNIILADVLWTSDGIPVCCHDNNITRVARTSEGERVSGVTISTTTYENLLIYDFGLAWGEEYRGTKILTLRELLNFVKLTGVKLWLEFKNFDSPNYSIRDTVELTYEYGIADRIVWCGGVAAIRTVHNVYPNVALAFLASEGEIDDSTFNTVMSYKQTNDLYIFGWTTTTLTQAQKNIMIGNGSKFVCGTLNTKREIVEFILQNPFCCGMESDSVVATFALTSNFFKY